VPTNGVINPRAKWRETWDIIILFLVLYSSVVTPFRICFSAEAEGNMWWFEVFISLYFLCDVILNFNTSFSVDDKCAIACPLKPPPPPLPPLHCRYCPSLIPPPLPAPARR
jgi:hypothetical protein